MKISCVSLIFSLVQLFLLLGEVTGSQQILTGRYHDLTGLIDRCLKAGCSNENGTNSDKMALEGALSKSPLVFYSTDLLLNEFDDLASVFQLFLDLQPKSTETASSKLSVMVSLRYIHENRFNWKRIDDAFYNLSLTLRPEMTAFLRNHVSSGGLVLDWRTDECQDSDTFYSKPAMFHGYGFEPTSIVAKSSVSGVPYSFPDYVKNFLHLHCPKRSSEDISVGIAYQEFSPTCRDGANRLSYQMESADFVLISKIFPSFPNFPVHYNNFKKELETLELHKKQLRSRVEQIVYHVDLARPLTVDQLEQQWEQDWPSLISLLSSSAFYKPTTRQMVKRMRYNSVNLAKTFLSRYVAAKERSSSRIPRVVLGASIATHQPNLSVDLDNVTATKGELIPHYFTNEILGCDLQLKTGDATFNRVVINVDTWRALARLQKGSTRHSVYCSHASDSVRSDTVKTSLSAILIFDLKTMVMWSDLEKHLLYLLTSTPKLDQTTLTTLVFPETGLNKQTTSFITPVNSSPGVNYSIGCLVEFNEQKLEILRLKSIFAEGVQQFKNVMRTFCEEIFEEVTTMIWDIGGASRELDRYINHNYKLILLAREIFLKEFPGKEVIIQRGHLPDNKEFIQSWAEYYRVPVIY